MDNKEIIKDNVEKSMVLELLKNFNYYSAADFVHILYPDNFIYKDNLWYYLDNNNKYISSD